MRRFSRYSMGLVYMAEALGAPAQRGLQYAVYPQSPSPFLLPAALNGEKAGQS